MAATAGSIILKGPLAQFEGKNHPSAMGAARDEDLAAVSEAALAGIPDQGHDCGLVQGGVMGPFDKLRRKDWREAR